jgi:hypothetical protein
MELPTSSETVGEAVVYVIGLANCRVGVNFEGIVGGLKQILQSFGDGEIECCCLAVVV